MMLSLIAAMDKNRVIGRNNQLPWHLPADLKYFKRMTQGKPIVMGRKTFESIGHPLKGRVNVVLSHQPDFLEDGCQVFNSFEKALAALSRASEVMIIGGAHLFEYVLPIADKMYLTCIDHVFEGDTFFPSWDDQEWKIVSQERHYPDEENAYGYCFLELQRKQ
jgi:dihydrofolate reductase